VQWIKERGTAKLLRDFAAVRVVIWAVLIGPSLYFKWADTVSFVSVLSLLALVLSDLAVWQAGRAEVATVEMTENDSEEDAQLAEGPPPLNTYADLVERLETARQRLVAIPEASGTEQIRLRGKIEGVDLAISYAKEQA